MRTAELSVPFLQLVPKAPNEDEREREKERERERERERKRERERERKREREERVKQMILLNCIFIDSDFI